MARKRQFEAATLQEALGKASAALGVPEPDLHYEIVDTGRRGLFGLGQKDVCIRVEAPEAQQPPNAQELLGPSAERPHRRREPRDRGGRSGGAERAKPAASPDGGTAGDGERRPAREGQGRRRGRRRRRAGRSGKPANAEAARSDSNEREREPGRRRRSGSEARSSRPRRREPARTTSAEPFDGPPSPTAEEVAKTLARMLELMSVELQARPLGSAEGVRLSVDGEDRDLLLDKDAELLFALQFLLNRMARRTWPDAGRIQLCCDGYRSQREEELIELAKEVAQQVSSTGEPKRLHPMNPYERRLVHLTIREYADLTTESEGDGFLKKVLISRK
jgi:spoIIIJ-associated protein